MKDRWKILIICLIIAAVLSLLLLFLGFSFKTVELRQYGVLQYTFFGTVDATQTVRSNGNYLVGVDYRFISYPKGILKHQFTVNALTKDKSMISMKGIFIGQLISSEIINLHFNYGPQEYFKLVGKSAEEAVRQAIEQFLLTQIISSRSSVNSYISSNVCLNIQSQYSFIDCQYVSTGQLTLSAKPLVIKSQTPIQNYLKSLLQKTILAQKKMNIYGNGGFGLIQTVETRNAELFLNTSKLIVDTMKKYTNESSEIFAGGQYVLANPLLPVLSNQIKAISVK